MFAVERRATANATGGEVTTGVAALVLALGAVTTFSFAGELEEAALEVARGGALTTPAPDLLLQARSINPR